DAFTVSQSIAVEKDVEGVSAGNLGLLMMGRESLAPCTSAAAFECIRATGVDLVGLHAVVVGRSNIVGKPLAALLLAANATVTQCHRKSRNLAAITRQADVLVAAAGHAGLIGREHVREGAIVIDVGINRVSATPASSGSGLATRTIGDVRFDEVAPIAGWITP